MVVTKKFIFLHFPKTGGAFVRSVFDKLYPQRRSGWFRVYHLLSMYFRLWYKVRFENFGRFPAGIKLPTLYCKSNSLFSQFLPLDNMWERGSFHQLPGSFLFNEGSPKRVLFSIRNPFAQQASMYSFNSRIARHERRQYPKECFLDKEAMYLYNEYFADKPYYDLTFREHVKFVDEIKCPLFQKLYFPGIKAIMPIGFISLLAIFLISPNPREIMEMTPDAFDDFFKGRGYKIWLDRFRFIHTENLNRELYDFLLEMGHAAEEIKFVLQKQPENTSDASRIDWKDLYDDELIRHVYQKNRIFFEMFPEYRLAEQNQTGADLINF